MASAQSPKPLKHRSVVSSFIFKYPEGENIGDAKPQVALFRRSDKVNTYQHHLAPIAGSIDPTDRTPLEAAWREISEETTLTPESLTLLRQGKPYSFSDASIGREWTINPFAFKLNTAADEAHIQTDWEHDSWAWHDPLTVRDDPSFQGVPRLAESLRRVYPAYDLGEEAAAILISGLHTLRTDHESGARQLAGVALGILRDVVAALDADGVSAEQWWRNVRMAAWHIWKNGRPSMGAAVLSVLLAALKSAEDTLAQHARHPESSHSMKWRDAVLGDLERRIALRGSDAASAVSAALGRYVEENFAGRLAAGAPIVVLTLSESSTILAGLRQLVLTSGFELDLRVLESRPLFEGASLVGKLVRDLGDVTSPSATPVTEEGDVKGRTRVVITLWSDASAALASEGVDLLLIGADRISSSGDVSNKTGSLPAALSAKSASPSVKVVVLSESEKVAPPGDPKAHVVEDNDPAQISRAWKADYNSVSVRWTATALLTGPDKDNGDGGTSTADFPSHDGVEVSVKNIFFEWVQRELIDVYITEFGAWSAEDIARHSEALATEEKRLFGDL